MELFELKLESVNASFYTGCGCYLAPGHKQTVFIEPEKLVLCCSDCKRLVCVDRIKKAKIRLKYQ